MILQRTQFSSIVSSGKRWLGEFGESDEDCFWGDKGRQTSSLSEKEVGKGVRNIPSRHSQHSEEPPTELRFVALDPDQVFPNPLSVRRKCIK